MKEDHSHHPHMKAGKITANKAQDMRSISESEFQQLFEQIYYEHVDSLIKFAYFRLTDKEKAMDAVQDIFSNYFAYLKNIRAQVDGADHDLNHKAFLFRSLRNAIIDQYRAKKTYSLDSMIEEGFEESTDEDVTSGTETSLMYKHVVDKIRLLKPQYQELLYMRYIEGLSVTEIAEALGTRENTVSVQLHRVVELLKKHLS